MSVCAFAIQRRPRSLPDFPLSARKMIRNRCRRVKAEMFAVPQWLWEETRVLQAALLTAAIKRGRVYLVNLLLMEP